MCKALSYQIHFNKEETKKEKGQENGNVNETYNVVAQNDGEIFVSTTIAFQINTRIRSQHCCSLFRTYKTIIKLIIYTTNSITCYNNNFNMGI